MWISRQSQLNGSPIRIAIQCIGAVFHGICLIYLHKRRECKANKNDAFRDSNLYEDQITGLKQTDSIRYTYSTSYSSCELWFIIFVFPRHAVTSAIM